MLAQDSRLKAHLIKLQISAHCNFITARFGTASHK